METGRFRGSITGFGQHLDPGLSTPAPPPIHAPACSRNNQPCSAPAFSITTSSRDASSLFSTISPDRAWVALSMLEKSRAYPPSEPDRGTRCDRGCLHPARTRLRQGEILRILFLQMTDLCLRTPHPICAVRQLEIVFRLLIHAAFQVISTRQFAGQGFVLHELMLMGKAGSFIVQFTRLPVIARALLRVPRPPALPCAGHSPAQTLPIF